MIVLVIVAAILLIIGIVILSGKGDYLIAGYNTASLEERSKYNIKRLRGMIGGLLIVLAPCTFLLANESMAGSSGGITLIVCLAAVILANTWAKEKSR